VGAHAVQLRVVPELVSERIVKTEAGLVRGSVAGGVARFLGVPYAAGPTGIRRFALPQLPLPWSGVRDARMRGPNAPQTLRPFPQLDVSPLIGTGWRRGEEFLNADIYAPETQGARAPVMVFIHGGAWVAGCNNVAVQDGSAFARSGVVCVNINYRLGIEGFLPIAGAPTNLGLRDQLAALRWVRDNIESFGGDARNITVFGESAGAMSIADLVTSPLAKGLFRRAIIQSGHGSMVRSVAVADRLTRRLAKLLGVRANLAGFASRTVEECLRVVDLIQQPTTRIDLRDEQGHEPAFGLSRFLPVYGDDVLPEPPLAALAKGAGAEFDVLIGTNVEEMNIYLVPTGLRRSIGRWPARLALGRSQPQAGAILKAYGLGQAGTLPGAAFTDALHDLVFRLPARHFAAAHRGGAHFYEFGWRSNAFDSELGACHALELPFVFNNLGCCSGPNALAGTTAPQELAERIHRLWVSFAHDGALPWAPYDDSTRLVFALERGLATRDAEMAAARFLP
jgi:para-nitrobenzyl esterase